MPFNLFLLHKEQRGGGEPWRLGEGKALTAGSGGLAQWESVKIEAMTLGREGFPSLFV